MKSTLRQSRIFRYSPSLTKKQAHHSSLAFSGAMATAEMAVNCKGGPQRSALIFLGTGCSSAVPNALCLIQPSDSPCQVCSPSLSIPPQENPNYRCNTSLLIDYFSSEKNHKYILIDVGKTFREQVLRWFTFHKIPEVDSIILTHEHADAVLGLDDIRTVQLHSPTNDIDPIPVYLNQDAMESIAVKFPYLVQKKLRPGQEIRRVTQLEWRIIENDLTKPFLASGLQFCPLPVMHGEDYVCLGFLFGERYRVAYISDISRFLPTTENYISKDRGQQLDLLILDTLYKKGSHNTHFCFPQTLDAIKRICPKRALLIGMTHEFDHQKDNEFLEEWSARPTVVQVDELIESLKEFSIYTQSLGGIHCSIFRSIHGNMIVWYGAWMKRNDDDKRQLDASLLSMLANVASMAILLDHAFCVPLAGESIDSSPTAKIVPGDIVSLSSIGLPPSYHSTERSTSISSSAVTFLKDRLHKMPGTRAGVWFKSQDSPRVFGFLVWRSLEICYDHLLASDHRKTDFPLDVKYDLFRVVCVYAREEEEDVRWDLNLSSR